MKVRLYGFEVETTSPSVTLQGLFNYLEANSGSSDKSKNSERRIYVDCNKDQNYYLGLVVTVKNQKRFCRLESEKGKVIITVENLKGNEKLMEFNFFVLNKNNGLGLYQHYYQSCGITVFGSYLSTYYKNIRDSLIQKDITSFKMKNDGKISEVKENKIKQRHSGHLKFSPLVRQESLPDILNEFKRIKSFEYEYAFLDANLKRGVPLSKYTKKLREKLTFESKWSVSELAEGINNAIRKIKPRNGRINVVNLLDEDIALKIFDIPDFFGEEEFDDVAMKLDNLDVEKFASHRVVKELIEKCSSADNRYVFDAKFG